MLIRRYGAAMNTTPRALTMYGQSRATDRACGEKCSETEANQVRQFDGQPWVGGRNELIEDARYEIRRVRVELKLRLPKTAVGKGRHTQKPGLHRAQASPPRLMRCGWRGRWLMAECRSRPAGQEGPRREGIEADQVGVRGQPNPSPYTGNQSITTRMATRFADRRTTADEDEIVRPRELYWRLPPEDPRLVIERAPGGRGAATSPLIKYAAYGPHAFGHHHASSATSTRSPLTANTSGVAQPREPQRPRPFVEASALPENSAGGLWQCPDFCGAPRLECLGARRLTRAAVLDIEKPAAESLELSQHRPARPTQSCAAHR